MQTYVLQSRQKPKWRKEIARTFARYANQKITLNEAKIAEEVQR